MGLRRRLLLAVAAGGAAGGLARVAAELAASVVPALPHWAALVGVNVLGCLLVGWGTARGGRWASPVVTTGVLGGFTSFSGWVLDVLQLVQPAPLLALLLLLTVPVACVAACLAGLLLGERG